MTGHRILCLNSGSSSLKYALFEGNPPNWREEQSGVIEGLSASNPERHAEALREVFQNRFSHAAAQVHAVAHRFVHGGLEFRSPIRIDENVDARLKALTPWAPSHLPQALAGLESAKKALPATPQIACFDTAFHARLPRLATRLPLPLRFHEAGLRRFGFHGLSCESVVDHLGDRLPARTIIAHLGSGCSMTALLHGQPVETTMGFTPNSGLMMGTRCGDLEPGAVLHLLRTTGTPLDEIERLLSKESGLLGVSGRSADMRDLLAAEPEDEAAKLAIDLFCHHARRHVGALAAVLGGLDLLVFTGGIGEHAGPIRERITAPLLEWLSFETLTVPSAEERVMAKQAAALISPRPGGSP